MGEMQDWTCASERYREEKTLGQQVMGRVETMGESPSAGISWTSERKGPGKGKE